MVRGDAHAARSVALEPRPMRSGRDGCRRIDGSTDRRLRRTWCRDDLCGARSADRTRCISAWFSWRASSRGHRATCDAITFFGPHRKKTTTQRCTENVRARDFDPRPRTRCRRKLAGEIDPFFRDHERDLDRVFAFGPWHRFLLSTVLRHRGAARGGSFGSAERVRRGPAFDDGEARRAHHRFQGRAPRAPSPGDADPASRFHAGHLARRVNDAARRGDVPSRRRERRHGAGEYVDSILVHGRFRPASCEGASPFHASSARFSRPAISAFRFFLPGALP